MLTGKVTCVCNQESEQIATHSVVCTCGHSTELRSNRKDVLVLLLAVFLISFEKKRARCQLVLLEALYIEHIELLDLLEEVVNHAVRSWLESRAELELRVVHETDGRRVAVGLCDGMHELDTDLEVGEDDGIEDAHLRQGLDLEHSFDDDTEVAFAAEQHMV